MKPWVASAVMLIWAAAAGWTCQAGDYVALDSLDYQPPFAKARRDAATAVVLMSVETISENQGGDQRFSPEGPVDRLTLRGKLLEVFKDDYADSPVGLAGGEAAQVVVDCLVDGASMVGGPPFRCTDVRKAVFAKVYFIREETAWAAGGVHAVMNAPEIILYRR